MHQRHQFHFFYAICRAFPLKEEHLQMEQGCATRNGVSNGNRKLSDEHTWSKSSHSFGPSSFISSVSSFESSALIFFSLSKDRCCPGNRAMTSGRRDLIEVVRTISKCSFMVGLHFSTSIPASPNFNAA